MQGVAWSADGRMLASCGDDNTIQVWDRKRGQQLQTLRRDRPYERLDSSGVKGVTEAEIATLRALGAIEPTPAGVYIGRFAGGKICSFRDVTLFPCCSTNRFRWALNRVSSSWLPQILRKK